ncbi:hypothetical protein E2I00_014805, partial [Balaenoptera physalus]
CREDSTSLLVPSPHQLLDRPLPLKRPLWGKEELLGQRPLNPSLLWPISGLRVPAGSEAEAQWGASGQREEEAPSPAAARVQEAGAVLGPWGTSLGPEGFLRGARCRPPAPHLCRLPCGRKPLGGSGQGVGRFSRLSYSSRPTRRLRCRKSRWIHSRLPTREEVLILSQEEFRDNREKEKAQRGLLGHRGPRGVSSGAELLGQAAYKGRENEGAEYSLG